MLLLLACKRLLWASCWRGVPGLAGTHAAPWTGRGPRKASSSQGCHHPSPVHVAALQCPDTAAGVCKYESRGRRPLCTC